MITKVIIMITYRGQLMNLTFPLSVYPQALIMIKLAAFKFSERFRRRLEMEIKRGDEIRTLKEELKKKRQRRRTASNPYLKKEKREETEQ